MACIYCEDEGYWVCEPDVEAPACGPNALPPGGSRPFKYLGRYQINPGRWSVWLRANTVSISDCQPSPSNGGAWDLAGCLDFQNGGDYDVWQTQPGKRIKIELSADTDCSECD